jgi:membrane protein YqaA with SNARE-associated domain
MSGFIRHLLTFILHLGLFGPLVLGVLDSSFLFMPLGNDLLIVALTARHRVELPAYVAMAACGSTLGVFLLDLLARKGGEEGVQKKMSKRRFEYLRKKVGERAGWAIVIGCMAPPPFPFTLVVAVASALGYPRHRLLVLVFVTRVVRFTLVGLLAIWLGRQLLEIAKAPAFVWSMVAFILVCALGSGISIASWIRRGRTAPARA